MDHLDGIPPIHDTTNNNPIFSDMPQDQIYKTAITKLNEE